MKTKLPRDAVIRISVLVIALINQILEVFGKNPLPFSQEEWYQFISGTVTVVSALWVWWKNRNQKGENIL